MRDEKRAADFLISMIVTTVLYCTPLADFSGPAQRCLATTTGGVMSIFCVDYTSHDFRSGNCGNFSEHRGIHGVFDYLWAVVFPLSESAHGSVHRRPGILMRLLDWLQSSAVLLPFRLLQVFSRPMAGGNNRIIFRMVSCADCNTDRREKPAHGKG